MPELKENLLHADGNSQSKPENILSENEAILNKINDENAHDAEDQDNKSRHEIPLLDYETMSLEDLVKEFKRLLHHEKIQAIKEHIEGIRTEFEKKFAHFLDEKKEAFLQDGNEEKDFKYVSPVRNQFNELYDEYKSKRNVYYKELEQKLQANLARRQDIIHEIKNLITIDTANSDTDINVIFKKFKDLREQWYSSGAVPRENYNDLWNNFNHHVENFYDYLDLHKDLREMDFRHNLEEKTKIIQKAESLLDEPDGNKAFRELQLLHKQWKEETGPVDREHREVIWEKFSRITKAIHDKRQAFVKNLEKSFDENLKIKNEIIQKIKLLSEKENNSHGSWQKTIKDIEKLREVFMQVGRVPAQVSEQVWGKFKQVVRDFNHKKNLFYKTLKRVQQENLEKKLELIRIAQEHQNSEDWDKITPLMKDIQDQWRAIGHVPRKHTDKIWKDFKDACNHYFDRLHQHKNSSQNDSYVAFDKKKAFLDSLKTFELSNDKEKNLEQLQTFENQWNELGVTPKNKRNLEIKFHKIINALYRKLDMNYQDIELIKYNNRLEHLANENTDSLIKEQLFVRRKISELQAEILQLENNLLYFSNVDENNPLVRDVIKKIQNQKIAVETWQAKLKELKSFKKNQKETK